MDHFQYINGTLRAENIPLPQIAQAVGTPFYCYSQATFERHFNVYNDGLYGLNRKVCFAMKSNSNLAVLKVLANAGSGADVVSQGEIMLAMKAGMKPENIVFSGVGKTREEMHYALEQGIFQFNAESQNELLALNEVAGHMGIKAPVALRVNPDVDPQTHAKISTGNKETKFGIAMEQALDAYRCAHAMEHLDVQGVSVHIGSQLTSLAPFEAAYKRVCSLVETLRAEGIALRVVDLGGGLGIPYVQSGDAPPLPAKYGEMIREVFAGMDDVTFVFEPGRLIAGNAGILVSKVIYVKDTGSKKFIILDAAMNDLLRPTLYEAHHDVIPVVDNPERQPITADIVGPVCETGDIFAADRTLAALAEGELCAIRSCGAYGAVMSSTYNARPMIPEVLVSGDQFAVVRARPSYEDMLASNIIPEWL